MDINLMDMGGGRFGISDPQVRHHLATQHMMENMRYIIKLPLSPFAINAKGTRKYPSI